MLKRLTVVILQVERELGPPLAQSIAVEAWLKLITQVMKVRASALLEVESEGSLQVTPADRGKVSGTVPLESPKSEVQERGIKQGLPGADGGQRQGHGDLPEV